MIDVEAALTRHLAECAHTVAVRPDLAAVERETQIVTLRTVARRKPIRQRWLALTVAALLLVALPVVAWRAANVVREGAFAAASRGVPCRVAIRPEASEETIMRIGNALRPRPDVHDLRLITQQMAFEEFRRLFSNKPDIIEYAEPFMLPAHWQFDLFPTDALAAHALIQELERDPSVLGASCDER